MLDTGRAFEKARPCASKCFDCCTQIGEGLTSQGYPRARSTGVVVVVSARYHLRVFVARRRLLLLLRHTNFAIFYANGARLRGACDGRTFVLHVDKSRLRLCDRRCLRCKSSSSAVCATDSWPSQMRLPM